MAQTINAVVFDFDGVLVDSEPVHFQAFLEVMTPLGLTLDYAGYLAKYVGCDDRQAFSLMLGELGQSVSAPPIVELIASKQRVFERLAGDGTTALPGAVELIDSLHRHNVPLAICSGATRRDIDLMLGCLGRVQCFDQIVSADDVKRSKPDPAGYRLAVERLASQHPARRITPGTCLAIEDTVAGLASATAAGLPTLALRTTTPDEPFNLANAVVDDLTHVDARTLMQLH